MKFPLETATADQIAKLSGDWCSSFSGGKDSTTVNTLIEWFRRSGQIRCDRPQMVRCDTTVEDPHLQEIANDLTDVLTGCNWECAVVQPRIHEKLYNRIFGIGNTPVHPGGGRFMRWCTRSTKIDPMDRWRKQHASGLVVTGLRIGESTVRDAKLAKRGLGCSAGGECGIPPETDNTYSPILNWTMCNVIDWLSGAMSRKCRETMADILPITKRLVDIYNVSIGQDGLWDDVEKEVSAARYGCTGCPAIEATPCAPKSVVKKNGKHSPLNEIYRILFEARQRHNRLVNPRTGGLGPIKMAVRKRLFAEFMDIQRRAGVVLITPDDEAFIRQCWAEKRYPRGWSEADEAIQPTEYMPMFDKQMPA